jgi:hypothetical protein
MYASVTTGQVQPDKLNEFLRLWRDSLAPALPQLAGFTEASVLTDQETGKVITTVMYATKENAQAVQTSRSRQMDDRGSNTPRSGWPCVRRSIIVRAWYNMSMSDEQALKLYALAVTAMRTVDNQTAIGVQSVLALLTPGGDIQADALGAARSIFPESDGWYNHFVDAIEIVQNFPIAPYQLAWQAKRSE